MTTGRMRRTSIHRHAIAVLAVTAVLMLGCSDNTQESSAVTSTSAVDEVDDDCVEEVTRSTGDLPVDSALAGADRLVVTAVTDEGCAPLEGPLVALNWRSFDDTEAYARYETAVRPILVEQGHTPVMGGAATVEVLESPGGAPENGGAYVHEEFAFPVYSSAAGFLDMLASPEWQAASADQQAGARQGDYVWGLQHCHVGCADNLTELAGPGLYVLHIFDQAEGELSETMAALDEAAGGPEVFYGGELVAMFELEVGGNRIRPQKAPWGNGTLVYRVDSLDEAKTLADNSAMVDFRRGTTDDMLAVLRIE